MAKPTPIPDTEARPEEAALLARLRAGDSAAAETFVMQHTPRALATARRILHNDADAQDAVQDAFLSAFRALPDFDGRAALGTWLHRIVVNAALQRLRRRPREGSLDALLPRFKSDGHHADPILKWQAPNASPTEQAETRAAVRSAIGKLPDQYREVLVLRDLEGMDGAATAAALGDNENNVKVRLHRARLALRRLLQDRFAVGAP
jgi:RNA polymerase sigma-70 factor, ECF subfamily